MYVSGMEDSRIQAEGKMTIVGEGDIEDKGQTDIDCWNMQVH